VINRIYLAGPWIARAEASRIASNLESLGYTITHPWWDYDGEGEDKEDLAFLRSCAEADVKGVETADAVVVYNTAKSEGKAVEQGIAIARGIPVICWTPFEKPSSNIFHYLPNYTHVKTFDEVLEAIGE